MGCFYVLCTILFIYPNNIMRYHCYFHYTVSIFQCTLKSTTHILYTFPAYIANKFPEFTEVLQENILKHKITSSLAKKRYVPALQPL